ncbi:MAG: SDR family NAD(P)-dependent oxidoreductase [Candidatus Neomarinimicrobiota bacterium]
MVSLQQKTVLITGASSGIGAACARAFAQAGTSLVLLARRQERLETLQQQLQERYGSDTVIVVSDVAQREKVTRAFKSLPRRWQAVDILVNNAGLALGVDNEWEARPQDIDAMIDVNVKGLLTLTGLCIPGMIERGLGHVINLGSIAGQEPYPTGSVYCATKFAVRALSRGLKMDLLGTPVRVTSIDPGLVQTEFSAVRFYGDKTRAEAVYEGLTPLTAEDIAEAVLFAATRPAHVNISEMLILSIDQAAARMVHRQKGPED